MNIITLKLLNQDKLSTASLSLTYYFESLSIYSKCKFYLQSFILEIFCFTRSYDILHKIKRIFLNIELDILTNS